MQELIFSLAFWSQVVSLALSHRFTQALVVLIGFWILYMIIHRYIGVLIHRVVRRHAFGTPTEEKQREDTLVGTMRTASAVLVWVVALISVLIVLDVNLSGLLTGAGLIGIIIGFGAQSVIKDFLAGFFIILENQYRVGDIVTLRGTSDVSGVVESLTIRVTKLRDLDGNQHTVQNGDIDIVTNMSFGFANVNVDVGVAYDSNMDTVIQTINKVGEALAKDKEWQERVIEPIVFLRIDEFAESSLLVKSVGRVMPGTQWDVAGEFRLRLKQAFDKAGIEIPLPQRVIYMDDHKSKKHRAS